MSYLIYICKRIKEVIITANSSKEAATVNTAKIKMTTIENTELEIKWVNVFTAGHGHKKITVELCYENQYKEFSSTTNNMPDYDDACDLEGSEKDQALFNLISYKIQDEISEWITELEN